MFKFKLEPVLRYRAWIEDQKQLVFAERRRLLMAAIAKRDRLKDIRMQYFEAMREEAAREDLSLNTLSFYQSYIFWIEKDIDRAETRVAEETRKTDAAKAELLDAKKNKEVMSKAKGRARVRYNEKEATANQKTLDDISAIRHVRAARGLDRAAAKG